MFTPRQHWGRQRTSLSSTATWSKPIYLLLTSLVHKSIFGKNSLELWSLPLPPLTKHGSKRPNPIGFSCNNQNCMCLSLLCLCSQLPRCRVSAKLTNMQRALLMLPSLVDILQTGRDLKSDNQLANIAGELPLLPQCQQSTFPHMRL